VGRGLSDESKDLIQRIYSVFEEEHPTSPRRCAYALFGNKAGAMAAKVGGLIGRMLEDGSLPLAWVDDSSRTEVKPYAVENMDAFADLARSAPDFDPWQGQPIRLKCWSEKAVGGTLAPVLDALCVPYLNTSGWNSRVMLMREAELSRRDPRRLVIIYVGDHDAAGLRMSEDDLPRRLTEYGAKRFEIRRVAMTRADDNALPGLRDPVKKQDPNAAWYLKTTGLRHGIELEALPAPELRARVEAAIRACIEDVKGWNRVMAVSKTVRQSWQDYAERWPRPQVSILGPDPR
jgi:hypothetical protein